VHAERRATHEDGNRPILLVLEDVHWADDATLGVLRCVGRRVVDPPHS